MVKDYKKEAVKEISQKLQSSELVVITNYNKLSVAADRSLRSKLRAVSSEYKVYKNTLTKIALKDNNIEVDESIFAGPTSYVFSADPVSPAKVLVDFSKENEALQIKGGIYQQKVISLQQVKDLANMPSKQELLSKLVYVLNSPIYRFVNVMQGPLRKLVYAVNAVAEKKGN